MPLPLPPYTYNDPRLIYNEHCFYYNGGYSDVCLNPPTESVRRRGGKSTRYTYPKAHHSLDVLISVELSGSEEIKYTRFRDMYENDPDVHVFDVKTGVNEDIDVYVTSIDVISTEPSFSIGRKIVEMKDDVAVMVNSFYTESIDRKKTISVQASIITTGSFGE